MPTNQHDLLLRGGTLLDPAQRLHAPRDVAFRASLVSAVAESIDPASANEVIDVSGLLVTPGLMDLHGHFYDGGTGSATRADDVCLPAGVTTGIDAGSAGVMNYRAMLEYVFPTQRTRLLALLHIGATGLAASRVVGGELRDLALIDVDRTAEAIRAHSDVLLGVKVRMHHDAVAHWQAHEAMRLAREAAERSGGLLMVHVSATPIPLPDILEFLRPGDVLTHVFNGNPEGILDGAGRVRAEVLAATERGVVMDVAHAGVHFDIEVARAALEQGFSPTTISTDIHRPPPGRVVYRQHEVMSTLLALGMPLDDVVATSTSRPAQVIGLDGEIGSLAVGMAADAAVFALEDGACTWQDTAGHEVESDRQLATRLTVRDGEVVWRADGVT